MIASMMLFPAQLTAQVSIPDHCFIDGEIDCTRPECEHICYTPPTPGYESMPLAAPQSGLENDTIEENATQIIGRPGLKMPLHEEPLILDTQKEEKKLVPLPVYENCPKEETDELKDSKLKYNFFLKLLENDEERINNHFFDKRESYKSKQNHEEMLDLYEFKIMKESCYKHAGRCILGPDKETKNLITDYFMTLASIDTYRKRIYDYYYNCTDMKLDCSSYTYSWTLDCDKQKTFSCLGYSLDVESKERAEKKRAQQLEVIKSLQCGP